MKAYTTLDTEGDLHYHSTDGDYIGILASSVGQHGDSTGMFRQCETTTPLTELGITHVDSIVVLPHE